MGPAQKCKNCRGKFGEGSDERNYDNWQRFGFKSREDFEKHSSRNPKCPCKENEVNVVITATPTILDYSSIDEETNLSVVVEELNQNELPLWPPYNPYKNEINEKDYVYEQEDGDRLLQKHKRRKGNNLWFGESEEASVGLINGILNKNINFLSLVAEPGSGKTMVTHSLIFDIIKLPWEHSIRMNNITLLTGMSDKDWLEQLVENLTLATGDFLLNDMNRLHINHCVVHRSNFHKRITYILDNLEETIHDHIFVIDESHFADSEEMTIDNEFRRLGLTEERMKEYNIKIILISATPDVTLNLLRRSGFHGMIQLKPGIDYKGFKYFYDKKMIINFDQTLNIEATIRSRYKTPKYHYIRARTNIEKGQFQKSIKDMVEKNNWILIEDDSENNYYLTFKNDKIEKRAIDNGKKVVKTYEAPVRHTIILIKDKYSASKRLKLTKYTGIIAEKPSKKQNTTSTCNGLIPRFWGHGDEPDYINNEKPLFICDLKAVKEYMKFSENFIYNGKDYNSIRIKSDRNKIKEIKNTCYGNFANQEAITHKKDIHFESFTNVEGIAPFLRNSNWDLFQGIHDITLNNFNKNETHGYLSSNRFASGHPFYDKKLIENDYNEKFKKNGGGFGISNAEGSGQKHMIYPVYKSLESEPTDVTFWLHYYKKNDEEEEEESF